jgi:prophage regulatory protein
MTVIFLKRPEIEHRTGLKRSTIYDKMKDGTFPKPVKLGARAVAWLEPEIDAWIKERISQRGEKKC